MKNPAMRIPGAMEALQSLAKAAQQEAQQTRRSILLILGVAVIGPTPRGIDAGLVKLLHPHGLHRRLPGLTVDPVALFATNGPLIN